ncbi:MAG: hypothetical protein AAGF13_06800 [Pseudomonadota bacterium]
MGYPVQTIMTKLSPAGALACLCLAAIPMIGSVVISQIGCL